MRQLAKQRRAFFTLQLAKQRRAFFTLQLATGNAVVAKPAEQTPLIARKAHALMIEAGVPMAAFQLLEGEGASIGAALVADPRIAGVVFTGSNETARLIDKSMANTGNPDAILVAETGVRLA